MRRRSRTGLAPSLFPFLAVLVCTLGTLILLLALVAKDAEDTAHEVAEKKRQDSIRESARLTQQEKWKREELQALRVKQTKELEKRRSELGHLEDHMQRIRQQLEDLQDEMRSAYDDEDSSRVEVEKAITDLQRKIDEKTEDLEATQQEKEEAAPRVVLVPHRGPSGTRRRPIYLECTGDSIIIQPEGVRVTIAQLRGPTGPGNPLDAALRTIRNHWEKENATGGEPPYPLLVVRPDGILAYLSARVSMTAWDDQYGYELVPKTVELAYPEPDEYLAQRTEAAIDEAILRRRAIVNAVPGRFRKGMADADPIGDAIRKTRERQRNGFVSGGVDARAGSGQLNSNLQRAASQSPSGSPLQRWNRNLNDSLPGQSAGNFASGANRSSAFSGSRAAEAFGSNGNTQRQANSASQIGTQQQSGDAQDGGSSGSEQQQYALGQLSRDGGDSDNFGGTLEEGFATGAASGEGKTASDGGGNPEGYAQDGSASGSPAAGNSATANEALPTQNGQQSMTLSAGTPLADQRGEGWALNGSPGSQNGPAVVRNLNIRCTGSEFVLKSRNNRDADQVVAIDPNNPAASVVQLAKYVRKQVDGWGLALTGGRWQPILKVAVTEDGQENYRTLHRLLEGSGIAVSGRLVR